MKRYYIISEIIDNDAQLASLDARNQQVAQASGIEHFLEVTNVPDARIALVYVDAALVDSGEYYQRMNSMVANTINKVFDVLEEAIIEEDLQGERGAAAGAQVADFFNGTRH